MALSVREGERIQAAKTPSAAPPDRTFAPADDPGPRDVACGKRQHDIPPRVQRCLVSWATEDTRCPLLRVTEGLKCLFPLTADSIFPCILLLKMNEHGPKQIGARDHCWGYKSGHALVGDLQKAPALAEFSFAAVHSCIFLILLLPFRNLRRQEEFEVSRNIRFRHVSQTLSVTSYFRNSSWTP